MTGAETTGTADWAARKAQWTDDARNVAVLTGAGISTDSGIPDFRGPSGIWTRDPAAEKMSTYQVYVSDPAVRQRSWQARLSHPAWTAQPNAAHLALARLAASPIDTTVITQNIDGLHQRAGTPADRVLELHGTMYVVVCVNCEERTPMSDALARVRAGEVDPPCADCGGILKSATVMFGQQLDLNVLASAAAAAGAADLPGDRQHAHGRASSIAVRRSRRCRRPPGHRQSRPDSVRPTSYSRYQPAHRRGRPGDR